MSRKYHERVIFKKCGFIARLSTTLLLSYKNHLIGRGMKYWRNMQAYFAELRHRPLGGLLQLL